MLDSDCLRVPVICARAGVNTFSNCPLVDGRERPAPQGLLGALSTEPSTAASHVHWSNAQLVCSSAIAAQPL